MPSAPGTPGAGASAPSPPSAHRRRPTCVPTSPRWPRRTWAVSPGISSPPPAGSRSCVPAPWRGRTRSSAPTSRRGARSYSDQNDAMSTLPPPATPLAAVTHADPYPYYAALVAERPLYRDDALGLWIASSAATVRAVMTSEHCRVRPAAEPVPKALVGSPAGEISGHLASLDPAKITDQAATCARWLAEEIGTLGSGQSLADFAFRLPTYVVATMLGFPTERLPALAQWTLD